MANIKRNYVGLTVTSANGDFKLIFEHEIVRISRDDKLLLELFASEYEDLFAAVTEGFSLMEVKPTSLKETPPSSSDPSITFAAFTPPYAPDPLMEDDPNFCYIIRHENADRYFGELDMDHDSRQCSSPKEKAVPFDTQYAAIRFTQAMRHPNTILKVPALYIVSWQMSPQGRVNYYDGTHTEGTTAQPAALRMNLQQAQTIVRDLPTNLIIKTIKVPA